MNNKDNKYNQYRKKRASAHFRACYAPKKRLKPDFSLFWAFYADVAVDKNGIRFNNHKHE